MQMNGSLKAILMGALIGLAACVSGISQSRSRGLEEIVSCLFDSDVAQEMITSYYSDNPNVRLIYLDKVEPEIASRFDDGTPNSYDYVKSFYRPKGTFSIFGAKVHGILFFSMHGSRFFSVLAEGDIQEVKSRIESHAGLVFRAHSNSSEPSYTALGKLYENGFSLGSYNIDEEVETRSLIGRSKKTPSSFVIGCAFGVGPGPHGR